MVINVEKFFIVQAGKIHIDKKYICMKQDMSNENLKGGYNRGNGFNPTTDCRRHTEILVKRI